MWTLAACHPLDVLVVERSLGDAEELRSGGRGRRGREQGHGEHGEDDCEARHRSGCGVRHQPCLRPAIVSRISWAETKIRGAGRTSRLRRRRSRRGRRSGRGWVQSPRCRLPPSQRCGRRRMPRSPRPRPPRPFGRVGGRRRTQARGGGYLGKDLSLGTGQGRLSLARELPRMRDGSLPAGQGVAAAGRRKVLGVLVHRRRAGHRGGRWRREHDDDGRRPTQATPASPKLNPASSQTPPTRVIPHCLLAYGMGARAA